MLNLRRKVLPVAAVVATALAAGPVLAQDEESEGPRVPAPAAVQPVYLEAEDLLPALESFDAPPPPASTTPTTTPVPPSPQPPENRAVARRTEVEDVASGNAVVDLVNRDVGTRMTLRFRVPASGAYNVGARLGTGPAYGTLQPSIDGRPLGGAIDTYASEGEAGFAEEALLGRIELAQGDHTITFTVTGKAEASGGLGARLDYVSLEP
jgi:hypothetical protein